LNANKKRRSVASTYNKERTKSKLIKAVGKILIKEGHQNIRINKIEEVSGVAKKSIYDYFGGLDGLIKAYLDQVDFWKVVEHKLGTKENTELPDISVDFLFNLLKSDFQYFFKSTEMQKIVLWGISEKNKIIRMMNEDSEKLGELIFEKADDKFKGTEVDFRATTAIFVASIYYMVLHSKNNGSTMCGIDISTEAGKNRIFNALCRLINLTYKDPDEKF